MYYIYEIDTNKVVATTDDIDSVAFDYDWDLYGATQSPAFGFEGGLTQ